MNPRARCPVCGQAVATHDGRLVRHHGAQMRWSGSRWFRTTCRGSGQPAHTPGAATTKDAEAALAPFDAPAERTSVTLEEGRRLASQREDLIARGADPGELAIPLAPSDPGDAAGQGAESCQHDWTLRPESDTWVCEMCGAER